MSAEQFCIFTETIQAVDKETSKVIFSCNMAPPQVGSLISFVSGDDGYKVKDVQYVFAGHGMAMVDGKYYDVHSVIVYLQKIMAPGPAKSTKDEFQDLLKRRNMRTPKPKETESGETNPETRKADDLPGGGQG